MNTQKKAETLKEGLYLSPFRAVKERRWVGEYGQEKTQRFVVFVVVFTCVPSGLSREQMSER